MLSTRTDGLQPQAAAETRWRGSVSEFRYPDEASVGDTDGRTEMTATGVSSLQVWQGRHGRRVAEGIGFRPSERPSRPAGERRSGPIGLLLAQPLPAVGRLVRQEALRAGHRLLPAELLVQVLQHDVRPLRADHCVAKREGEGERNSRLDLDA